MQASYSDHDLILVNTHYVTRQNRARGKQLHRFEERWVAHQDCENIITEAWNLYLRSGSPMFNLFERIKHCRLKLVAWSRVVFGNSKLRMEEKQRELEDLINLGCDNNLEQIYKKKRKRSTTQCNRRNSFWRQCSRAKWLSAGDKNTKFFHKRSSQRKRKNQIDGLLDEEGI